MVLILSKPTTPSQRHLVKLNRKHLKKNALIKQKTLGLKTRSGRNHSGKVTCKCKGGGHKKIYRKIDFSRTRESIGIVIGIEYDPNRNTNIASVYDISKNNFFYILAPKRLNAGNIVESGYEAKLYTGNSLPLFKLPEGSFIHNITLDPEKKAQITRSAGNASIIKEKTIDYARIQISSKIEKKISLNCYATLGILSNEDYFLTQLGKAGQSRWLNKRPKVRGVAMNPVDHPHGGGEGKKSGKRFSPWGKPKKKIKLQKK